MSILLIRHGETALNAARVLQPADTPLSGRGIRQVEALAARLGRGTEWRVARILSSDLPRAWQTAQALAAATGAPIETTPLLQERNFGDWRGLPYDGFAFDPLRSDAAPPGGESRLAFQQRVAEAFAHVVRLQGETPGHLAVVTHGLVIATLLARHAALPSGIQEPDHLSNSGLSVLDADTPHTVLLLDCTAHLAGDARDDAKALSGG